MTFVNIADLKPAGSDKTYRQLNAEMIHRFPIGVMVNYRTGEWDDDRDAYVYQNLQLYVVSHDRDCDQTPLYTLSMHTEKKRQSTRDFLRYLLPDRSEKAIDLFSRLQGEIHGIPEEGLSLVPQEEYLKDHDAE